MNDFQIDQSFKDMDTDIASSLEDKILADSTKALKKSCFVQMLIRRCSAIAAILLFGFTAFFAGRLSTNNIVSNVAPDMVTIQVPKDFPAWVDAGRFFTQLDMKDRAANAFDKALSMIPKDMPLANQNNPNTPLLCRSLTNPDSLTSNTLAVTHTPFLQYLNSPDATERKKQ